MWVKLTLPPWRRRRCPLRTLRLTSSSRAGTVRTEVAVGTSRLASIASTIRAAAPRSGTSSGSAFPSPSGFALAFGPALSPPLAAGLGLSSALAAGFSAAGSLAAGPWREVPPAGSAGRPTPAAARRPRPPPGPRRCRLPRPSPRRRRPGTRSRRRSPARRGSPSRGCPGTAGRSRRSARRWRRTPVVRTSSSAHHPRHRDDFRIQCATAGLPPKGGALSGPGTSMCRWQQRKRPAGSGGSRP